MLPSGGWNLIWIESISGVATQENVVKLRTPAANSIPVFPMIIAQWLTTIHPNRFTWYSREKWNWEDHHSHMSTVQTWWTGTSLTFCKCLAAYTNIIETQSVILPGHCGFHNVGLETLTKLVKQQQQIKIAMSMDPLLSIMYYAWVGRKQSIPFLRAFMQDSQPVCMRPHWSNKRTPVWLSFSQTGPLGSCRIAAIAWSWPRR